MKVLVTGGGGFLGYYILKDLISLGFAPISVSRNIYEEVSSLGVTQIKKDILNLTREDLEGVESIIHTASKAGIWGKKEEYFKTNVDGAIHLVNLAKECGIKYFIYTSTPSVVFGEDDIVLGDEALPYPKKFYTYYQESKKIAEEYILKACDKNFYAIALRPHLIFGPRDPNLLPRVISRARDGKLKIVGNRDNFVDVIYVENASLAHVKALKALIKNPSLSGNTYFLGQNEPVNLWDFIFDVLEKLKIELPEDIISFKKAFRAGLILERVYKFLGIIKPEPLMTRFLALQLSKSHYFSHEKAKRDFDYDPLVSTEEGIKRFLESKKLD